MANSVFAITVFFICFRECLESSIIVSVLLAFLKQALSDKKTEVVYKRVLKQVWLGVGSGLLLCLCIGAGMIGAFYGLDKDAFSNTEDIWEGIFGIIASIIISIMGASLLRISRLQDKWKLKLSQALKVKLSSNMTAMQRVKKCSEKYVMFLLPFITVLREGLEAVVYVGGVGLGLPATSFPLAVICGLLAGCLVGYLIYKGGNQASIQIFLITSTCFLYLVAAGLFSRAVWYFENSAWNSIIGGDASETGSGPGSYDIRQSVWHVNCCNPELNGGGGWGIFNALLGWTNSATYGSVISYVLYWVVIIISFLAMIHEDKHGYIPVWTALMRRFKKNKNDEAAGEETSQESQVPKKTEGILRSPSRANESLV